MKKQKMLSGLLIAVFCLIIIILTIIFYIRQNITKITVLSSEIDSVVLTVNPPNQTINMKEEQINELVGLLNSLNLTETDDSYQDYTGQWIHFDITKTDGTHLSIAELSPFIIIDKNCYKVSYKQNDVLNEFANGICNTRPCCYK